MSDSKRERLLDI
jgi:hypothetical protein